MKLKDLPIDQIDVVVTAPLAREQPDEDWSAAAAAGVIPASVYQLYRVSGCLDSTKPPRYLSAFQSIAVFGFFKGLMQSLLDAFLEAHEAARELARLRGQEWREVGANMKAWEGDVRLRQLRPFPPMHSETVQRLEPKVFRTLLLACSSALDIAAELVAIFCPGVVPRLRVGRADFDRIVSFVEAPTQKNPIGLVSLRQARSEQLRRSLRPLLIPEGPERGWWRFFQLYRNKVAHLGRHSHFLFGIADQERRMYLFLRKDWPFSLEAAALESAPKGAHITDRLIGQDTCQFANGLVRKALAVVDAIGDVTCGAFRDMRDSDPPDEVLRDFAKNMVRTEFEYFPDDGPLTKINGDTKLSS
jgi:hypothetical protein